MSRGQLCLRCGELLDPQLSRYRTHRYGYVNDWDACLHVARSKDSEAKMRVLHRMAETEPLLARYYDGDR